MVAKDSYGVFGNHKTKIMSANKNTLLTIIDGPDDGLIDDIINFDDRDTATFTTKELGEVSIYCRQASLDGPAIGKGNAVGISNDYCSINYDPVKKTGEIEVYDLEKFKENCLVAS